MRNLLLLLTLTACAATAQQGLRFTEQAPKAKVVWQASLVSLAAANALDVHSSWGKHELNPALATGNSATFGKQGALVKLGLQGTLMGIEYLITRGHPTAQVYKALAIVNFGASAGFAGVAAHNYTVNPPVR